MTFTVKSSKEKAKKTNVMVPFDPDQKAWIEEVASSGGVRQAEVVRQCVDFARANFNGVDDADDADDADDEPFGDE